MLADGGKKPPARIGKEPEEKSLVRLAHGAARRARWKGTVLRSWKRPFWSCLCIQRALERIDGKGSRCCLACKHLLRRKTLWATRAPPFPLMTWILRTAAVCLLLAGCSTPVTTESTTSQPMPDGLFRGCLALRIDHTSGTCHPDEWDAPGNQPPPGWFCFRHDAAGTYGFALVTSPTGGLGISWSGWSESPNVTLVHLAIEAGSGYLTLNAPLSASGAFVAPPDGVLETARGRRLQLAIYDVNLRADGRSLTFGTSVESGLDSDPYYTWNFAFNGTDYSLDGMAIARLNNSTRILPRPSFAISLPGNAPLVVTARTLARYEFNLSYGPLFWTGAPSCNP